MSRRERERDEELRQNLRKEIEEELNALRLSEDTSVITGKQNFPARALTHEELGAVTASDDFLDFIDRSTKVIERALDEEYDVLVDYAMRGGDGLEDDQEDGLNRTAKARRVRELVQFQDARYTKRRMISDLDYSVKVLPTKHLKPGRTLINPSSIPSFCWLRTPKPPILHKAHRVWPWFGTHTCPLNQNMSSLLQATF